MNDVLLPQTNRNCRFCNFNQWMPAGVRVLNAAVNYNPFSVTRYSQVNQGYQTVTLSGANGYIYLQKQVYVGDGMTTIAIVNAASGLDVIAISDTACATNSFSACIRVANLAYYSGPINVGLGILVRSVQRYHFIQPCYLRKLHRPHQQASESRQYTAFRSAQLKFQPDLYPISYELESFRRRHSDLSGRRSPQLNMLLPACRRIPLRCQK